MSDGDGFSNLCNVIALLIMVPMMVIGIGGSIMLIVALVHGVLQ